MIAVAVPAFDAMSLAPWIVLGLLGVLTVVGAWHARQVKTSEDFALAGRRLGPVVMIGTLVATWIGTGSIFGNAEFTYTHGWAAFALPLAGGAGIALLSLLAPRARDLPASSVPEILGIRFGRAAQLIGAFALIGAYLVIVSYQFRAGAAVAERMFPGLAPDEGGKPIALVVGFAIFVVLYTALAGMVSVAWTDLVNGIVMSIGLLLALGWAWSTRDAVTQPIPEEFASAGGDRPVLAWAGLLLPAFLLVLGDANLFQRFMSASSPAAARRSAVGMLVGVLVLELAVIGLALLGRAMLPGTITNPAHVIIEMAFTTLPPVIGLLIIVTATAVIITTADSYLLGASTSISVDFTPRPLTAMGQRAVVIVLGIVALGLAFTSDRFFRVALYAYTLYGASLTPAVICALLFPCVARRAVVAGMAAGLITALAWQILTTTGWTVVGENEGLRDVLGDIDAVLPALSANLIALVGVHGWERMRRRSEERRSGA